MTIDNHNHFCIYCGARIIDSQNFCTKCGKPIYKSPNVTVKKDHSKYDSKINELENEYDVKQNKAKELVEKLFSPDHMAYQKFMSSINKSNNLFSTQVGIARKMAELSVEENPFVEKEIENKIATLESFIDKIEDLTNELIIHLSSNKKDNEDIQHLFDDMDDLIHSVKDY